MESYTLLTGATGLVGRYLVRDLLLEGERLALVIRPSERESIHERCEAILQHWEREHETVLPRPVCLEGDVQREGLGLSAEDRRWVARHCGTVFHNAASLVFQGQDRRDEPWTTNLDGTRHVLRMCHDLHLRELHYVSTAYVCGRRQGTILESELDQGQDFRNDYEHCKFLAEKLVQDDDWLAQRTIYRPAVIAGDWHTGYTNTYHGLYLYLKTMSVLTRGQEPDANGAIHTPLRLHMTGDERRNVVPVDWVSQALCRLFYTPAAHGGTYHLAPIDPITPRQVINSAYEYFNSYGVEFCGPGIKDRSLMNDFELAVYDRMVAYESYEHTDPHFDTTNLMRFCHDLPCPRIDEPVLQRYMKFAEADRWGKRKQKPVKVDFWAGDYLRGLLPEKPHNHGANGHHTNGHHTNGHHANGNGAIGNGANGHSSNGHGANGNGKHGHGTNGHSANGHSANGNGMNGHAHKEHRIGLQVAGVGGGEWTLVLEGERLVSLVPGVQPENSCVATIPCHELARMAQGQSADGYERFREVLNWGGADLPDLPVENLFKALSPTAGQMALVLETAISGNSDPLPVKR